MATITKAVMFAAAKHTLQRRKNVSQSPYIEHPIRVAYILANIGKVDCETCLAAAYLHDVIEDTNCTYDEIVKDFGKDIADIVKEVSDDKSLPKVERKKLQVLNAFKKSYGARLV